MAQELALALGTRKGSRLEDLGKLGQYGIFRRDCRALACSVGHLREYRVSAQTARPAAEGVQAIRYRNKWIPFLPRPDANS